MCRRKHLHGACLSCFGLGLILGHCAESWLLCCGGGMLLVGIGFWVMGRR